MKQATLLELVREEVLRIDNGVATVFGLGVLFGHVGRGLGGHDEGDAVGGHNLLLQRPAGY